MVCLKEMKSNSSDRVYVLTITIGCQCEGYRYTGTCRHIKELVARLEENSKE